MIVLYLRILLLFQGQLSSWCEALTWSPLKICSALSQKQTTFKVCPKRESPSYHGRFKPTDVVFETMCDHVDATFSDFLEWLGHTSSHTTHHREGGDSDVKELASHCSECDVTTDDDDELESAGNDDSQPKAKRAKLAPPVQQLVTEITNQAQFDLECDVLQTTLDTTKTDHKKLTRITIDHREKKDSTFSAAKTSSNPLMQYPRSDHWVYADYKYMSQLCSDKPELLSAVKWEVLGFPQLDGKDSTLWVGSEGASTPCHYDTYGSNIVVQLSGRKKWMLFPPETGEECMYPTRIPYEESSVFSSVNVTCPDLARFPNFANAKSYEVSLSLVLIYVVHECTIVNAAAFRFGYVYM